MTGEQREEPRPCHGIEKREDERKGEAPTEEAAHYGKETRTVVPADTLTTQRLGSIGKAIREIGEDDEELHQQCIGIEIETAHPAACRGEIHGDGHKTKGAQEETSPNPSKGGETLNGRKPFPLLLEGKGKVECTKQQTTIQSYYRSKCHTSNFHSENEEKEAGTEDVKQVLKDGHPHGRASVLHTDEPSRKAVTGQHGGSAPDADAEVGRGIAGHLGLGSHKPKGETQQGRLQDKQSESNRTAPQQAVRQRIALSHAVPRPMRLRDNARRTHAKEAKQPINHVENGGPNSNGPYIGG